MRYTHGPLENYANQIEQLATQLGLDYYPIDFEIVPNNFMTEISVYGLPVRMQHWSFGIRYIHQLIRQGMGHSRIFEVMFPGDPCHAYLVNDNSVAENTLVLAHVIGHADFAKNNHLFARFMHMAGGIFLKKQPTVLTRLSRPCRSTGRSALRQYWIPRWHSSHILILTSPYTGPRIPSVNYPALLQGLPAVLPNDFIACRERPLLAI